MAASSEWRVASIGYEFEHPRVQNIDYRSTETVLSADVVFWFPEPLHELYGDHGLFDLCQYDGLPLISESASQRSIMTADRRRQELGGFLELGRSLVLFAPAPHGWYYYAGTRDVSGTGKNQKITPHVQQMNTLDLLPFPLKLVAASGRQMDCVGTPGQRVFWERYGRFFEHVAYMAEPLGCTFLQISRTTCAVGSYGSIGKGLVLVLPALADDDDEQYEDFSDAEFVDAVLSLLEEAAEGRARSVQPAWAKDVTLPGEADAIGRVAALTEQIATLSSRCMRAEQSLALLQSRKALFTGQGRDLEEAVRQALEALGFVVEDGPSGRADFVARSGEAVAVLEVKGLSKSARERDAAQLEKWVVEQHLSEGIQPKGILVVNSYSDIPIAKRPAVAFPSQMLDYAQAKGLCLITGVQLLGMWIEAERNPHRKAELRNGILKFVGVYPEYADWSVFLEELPSEPTDV